MRKILLAGLVAGLSACGGSETTNTATNTSGMDPYATNGMSMNQPMGMDQNASIEAVNQAAANGSVDANTRNQMLKDAQTNDPDTNLANGM